MTKKKRRLMDDKPWKEWTTRKWSFMYCLVFGTIIIALGAVSMFTGAGFDFTTWFTISLDFIFKVILTGMILTLVPLDKALDMLMKIINNKYNNGDE